MLASQQMMLYGITSSSTRELMPSLLYSERIWALTVNKLMTSCSAISALLSPCATRRNTSASRVVSPTRYVACLIGAFVACAVETKGEMADRPALVSTCSKVKLRPSAHAETKAFSPG